MRARPLLGAPFAAGSYSTVGARSGGRDAGSTPPPATARSDPTAARGRRARLHATRAAPRAAYRRPRRAGRRSRGPRLGDSSNVRTMRASRLPSAPASGTAAQRPASSWRRNSSIRRCSSSAGPHRPLRSTLRRAPASSAESASDDYVKRAPPRRARSVTARTRATTGLPGGLFRLLGLLRLGGRRFAAAVLSCPSGRARNRSPSLHAGARSRRNGPFSAPVVFVTIRSTTACGSASVPGFAPVGRSLQYGSMRSIVPWTLLQG